MWLTQVIVRHVCHGNAEGRYISESILKSLFYLATQSVNMASYFGRKNLKEKPGYWCMRCGRGKKYWDQNVISDKYGGMHEVSRLTCTCLSEAYNYIAFMGIWLIIKI